MRVRSLFVIAVLLPAALSAQRRGGVGRIGGRAVPPVELPPQPGTIASEMRYVRLPISAESYTFISFNQVPLAGGAFEGWNNLAAGTKFSLRLNSVFAATADLTQSIFYDQNSMTTFEVGTRFRPGGANSDRRVQFYADARVGYTYSQEQYVFSPDPTAVNPMIVMGSRRGNGFGVIGGVGSDFSLTRTLSLSTGVYGARSHLRSSSSSPFQPTARGNYYDMTAYRFALGIKWNPVRAVPYE
jgi:hypothetical protein